MRAAVLVVVAVILSGIAALLQWARSGPTPEWAGGYALPVPSGAFLAGDPAKYLTIIRLRVQPAAEVP